MKYILISLVWIYRKGISPFIPSRCRFYPTCSTYSLESLQKHGALKGTLLTLYRVLRCHPFHPGGYDPVPENFNLGEKIYEGIRAVFSNLSSFFKRLHP